jgi:hypothetical protein
MKPLHPLLIAAVLLGTTAVHAQLATYQFISFQVAGGAIVPEGDTGLAATTGSSLMSAGAITFGLGNGSTLPTIEGLNSGFDFPGVPSPRALSVRGTDSTIPDFAAAQTERRYIQFVLTPDVGQQLNLTSFSAHLQAVQNGSATLPTTAVFTTVVGGNEVVRDTFTGLSTVGAQYTASFSATFTEAVAFRIYTFGGSSLLDSFTRHDDLTVLGTVTAIPEPASAAALLGAGALMVFAGRRRARA